MKVELNGEKREKISKEIEQDLLKNLLIKTTDVLLKKIVLTSEIKNVYKLLFIITKFN